MSMEIKLNFSRFEFKYLLPSKLRDEIELELGHFMKLDPYVNGQDHKKYRVRSLYFDDPSFTNFYDKVDGIRSRQKFRIRTYSTTSTEDCATFLEIKGRQDALVYKHRVAVDLKGRGNFNVGERVLPNNILSRVPAGTLKTQFEYEKVRKNLMPVMLIDYMRRPMVSKLDPEFRLTFDDTLMGTSTNCLYPSRRDVPKKLLSGYTVMEVKFRRHIPKWFHRIIQSYDLQRVSISKVCVGIEKFCLVKYPE
jgi:hypothetical protein